MKREKEMQRREILVHLTLVVRLRKTIPKTLKGYIFKKLLVLLKLFFWPVYLTTV